ncbi:MAG: hypothetical protein A2X79_08375 [Desulfuromonadaceae bacterium GWB2_53_15]|nr:MAG: hypothetical protein A2X83_12520 [Desulfuromonadales bacterium GWD2_54_10]OHB28995.1 MAG: hypothetical protein A2X79_08375 [Desulfuromonadaceae bacterium GWB2_53_15]
MRPILIYPVVFVAGELLAVLLFLVLRRSVAGAAVFKKPDIETFKGILERLVLFTGLTGGYSTVLVMFGALKLGTRLHDETDKIVSNNYFLIGNLLSAFIAIADAIICGWLLKV